MSIEAMTGMYEVVVVPTIKYGSETWVIHARDKSLLEAVEVRFLKSMSDIIIYDRLRNEKTESYQGFR